MSPRVEAAVQQIQATRMYTLNLLRDLAPDDWFRQPTEGVTHIAWQVGHLAMAEYRLLLERVRGERPGDADLISLAFLKQFGKGSTPDPDPQGNPAPEEILRVFNRVHEQAMREIPEVADAEWDASAHKPHPLFTTKLGSLLWCSRHEMSHAGQIGLLRRLLGKAPQW